MSESQSPNPFSREASQPSDALGANPDPWAATPQPSPPTGDGPNDPDAADWPSYPAGDPHSRPAADPYALPGDPYGNSGANSTYVGPVHGFTAGPTPPYADPGQSYGQPADYNSNPYESNPYQPAFGGVSPYGVMPTEYPQATQHPQATLAMILGILGTVLGLSCIVGGLLGIGGIVVGRRVRREIDAAPGRYTGRSQAVAGIVTGIIGVSIFTLVTLLIVLAVVVGITSSGS